MDDQWVQTVATDPEPFSLTLLLDLAEEPVAGTMVPRDGPSATFSGWLELISTLEVTVRAARLAGSVTPDTRVPDDTGDGEGI